MTHISVVSGSATGGPPPDLLFLDSFDNTNETFGVVLTYVDANTLTLDLFTETNTSYDVELENVDVSELTLDHFANTNESLAVQLVALPFDPANDETEDLLAEFTGSYSTTIKIQIDTLITELKDAGVWAKLDWYVNGYFAANEHDSLINWITPAETLVKTGTVTHTQFLGWTGPALSTSSSRLKSGYNVGDGIGTATDFGFFCRIESTPAESGLQPMGNFELSTPGPAGPIGNHMSVSAPANQWSGGANTLAFDGVSGAGLSAFPGTLAATRTGTTVELIEDGASDGTDATAGNSVRTHADGMCIMGTPPGFGAGRAFTGVMVYAGWGERLTTTQMANVQNAFETALVPPATDNPLLTFVVIEAGNVGADLTDFPLLIDLTLLKASFLAEITTGAGNVRAYAADGTTLLYLDNVLPWDGSTGKIFVKSSLATATPTTIYLKIEGSSQPAVGSAGGRNGVWADYETVLFGDSTSWTDHSGKCTYTLNGHAGDVTSATVTDSKFPTGKGLWFRDDTPSFLGGESITSTTFAGGDLRSFTWSLSLMQHKVSTADNYATGSLYNSANEGQRKTMAWRGTDGSGQDGMQCWDSTNSWFKVSPTPPQPTVNVTKFRATLTYSANSSGTRRQIWDGPDGLTASASYSSHPVGNRLALGGENTSRSEPGNFYTDFVYVRSGVLSDHWLRAEYKMLTVPADIYTPEIPA